MNYRTTCPHCLSVFRLGADQLDAAQGWVQCSVCGTAFDARLSLLREDGSPLPPPELGPAESSLPPEVQPSEHETLAAEVPSAADEAIPPAPPPEETSPDIAGTPRGIVHRETSLDLDSIILIDPDIPVPDDPGPLPQIHTATGHPPEPAASMYRPTPVTTAAVPAARIEYASPMPGTPRRVRASPRIRAWVWGLASLLLLVVLLAQTAYFLRDTLASRLPQTRPAIEQACDVLGCSLSLPKDLSQLQIVGSDLQTEASGRLKLTLTLGNRADYAQAWPVLVLTLTDQHNRSLARRSFAPSEYLGDAQRITAGIPARSEQPLTLPLTVHKLTPMGFGLQLAY
ncbi:zinc-ribbon and DUF3426 domain-containing protein [Thiobacillus sp.]